MATSATTARRETTLLCLGLLAVCGWGLQSVTAGFEAWTFEGRRQVAMQAGQLQAAAVPLRSATGDAALLWHTNADAPAAYLVDFVYTRCPSVCRVLGSEYQQMQRELAADAAPGVQLVSVSFDVVHDQPAQLAQAAAALRADPATWRFVVPASADDAAALLRSLGVVAIPDGDGGFVHNGAIHLLDARGRLVGLFELTQWPQALAAARQLAAAPRVALR